VIAQFDFNQVQVAYPFKLNPTWLAEKDFDLILKEVWKDVVFLEESDIQHRIVWKLKTLKSRIKAWARQNRREKLRKLEILEEDISRGYSGLSREGLDTTLDSHLKSLESERNDILKIEEEYWRQKSRATWLKCGDRNTKFFHKFASARRNQKHIWEIDDDTGQTFRGQEEIKGEATRFFKKLYAADGPRAPLDQVNLVRLFQRFVTVEDNVLLDRVVTKQEIWDILSLFAKDKSPWAWTVGLWSFLLFSSMWLVMIY
jgi:hypothetical protein